MITRPAAYGMCLFDDDKPCYSQIGLAEVAYITLDGHLRGPLTMCATHRRWTAAHNARTWIDPATVRAVSEEDRLALREEQDAEDIIDSDGRLLPRGLR